MGALSVETTTIAIEDTGNHHANSENWSRQAVLVNTRRSILDNIFVGGWLALYAPRHDQTETWDIWAGTLNPRGNKLFRGRAKHVGMMALTKCQNRSDAHPATRVSVDLTRGLGVFDRSNEVEAVGYGLMTGIALQQGHAVLCTGMSPWATHYEEDRDGEWWPDNTTDGVLHELGYKKHPSDLENEVSLRRSDLPQSTFDDQARSALDQGEGIYQYAVGILQNQFGYVGYTDQLVFTPNYELSQAAEQ